MIQLYAEIILMLLAAYLLGCVGGCWLRRTFRR